jgi:signal transduction histidine kinase
MAIAWDNAQWTVAAGVGALVGALGTRGVTGRVRRVRGLVSLGIAIWLAGQLAWDAIYLLGGAPDPLGPLSVTFLAPIVPGAMALRASLAGRLRRGDEAAVYVDGAGVLFGVLAVLVVVVGPRARFDAEWLAFALFPLAYLAAGGAALVGALATRAEAGPRGAFAIVGAMITVGVIFTGWIVGDPGSVASAGSLAGGAVSMAFLVGGYGAATWTDAWDDRPGYDRVAGSLLAALPLAAAAACIVLILAVEQHDLGAAAMPFAVAVSGAFACLTLRSVILLRERGRMLTELGALNERVSAALEESRRVQARLVATSRLTAIGELAGAVAHEVNNPLTGILGFAELGLLEAPPGDPHREHLEVIRDEALRARAVVRSLQEFARPRSPANEATDLNDLVHRTMGLIRYHVERGGVRIVERYADLPMAQVDPTAISQVVLNLAQNAVQAMPDGGRLAISTAVDGSDAVIEIADSGPGMDEATGIRAFEPFFTTRDEGSGAGLGLPVALGLVRSHGGSIALDRAPGEGTRATVRLPLNGRAAEVD